MSPRLVAVRAEDFEEGAALVRIVIMIYEESLILFILHRVLASHKGFIGGKVAAVTV